MKRLYCVATGCCCLAWITSQAAVTFGPATFSTTDPNFLSNISITTTPSEWILQIPEFLVADFNFGQLQISLPVRSTTSIVSVGYEYHGSIVPDATAYLTQEVTDGTSFLTLASVTDALPGSGSNFGSLILASPTSDLFIQQTIDLESLSISGMAQVFEIHQQILSGPVPVPEGSIGWIPLGFVLAAGYWQWNRRNTENSVPRS